MSDNLRDVGTLEFTERYGHLTVEPNPAILMWMKGFNIIREPRIVDVSNPGGREFQREYRCEPPKTKRAT